MTKPCRIKVLPGNMLDSVGISVFMKECNVFEYDAYMRGMITRFDQYIEFQGYRSSGSPDLEGEINYRGKKLTFNAVNKAILTPCFEFGSSDGKFHDYYMSEGDIKPVSFDGINYVLKRLQNADDAILFELYVDVFASSSQASDPSTVHRRETIESL